MLILKDLFGVVTLQVGVVIFSSLFITLGTCILFVNILSLVAETPVPWIIMFLFVISMMIIWLIAFVGAYNESYKATTTAIFLWTVQLTIWIILVVSSFMVKQNRTVCLKSRCPNVMWLLNNSWHEINEENIKTSLHDYNITDKKFIVQPRYEKKSLFHSDEMIKKNQNKDNVQKVTTTTPQVKQPNVWGKNIDEQLIKQNKLVNEGISKLNTNGLSEKNEGKLILSIILILINGLILFYSWAVLFSYQKEMRSQNKQKECLCDNL